MILKQRKSDSWVEESQFSYEGKSHNHTVLLEENNFYTSWVNSLNELNQLNNLEQDWDGEDAEKPDSETIISIRTWLRNRFQNREQPPTKIIADTYGSIIIEWHLDGDYFEVEVSDPDHAEWMLVRGAEPATHGVFHINHSAENSDDTISSTESRPMHQSPNEATTWLQAVNA